MPEATSPLVTLSTSLTELVANAANNIVGVRSHGRLVASGFVWKTGAVVTASDALEADDDISLALPDGRAVEGKLAGRDPTTDIAVLRVGDASLQAVQAAASSSVRVGQL